MRKPVFMVLYQVRHKSGCTATEDDKRLEILDLGRRGIVVAKALFSCAVMTQLICAFVFTYAKSCFSHDATNIILLHKCNIHILRLNK